jgi:uncharacterized protein (TIGR02594 family)
MVTKISASLAAGIVCLLAFGTHVESQPLQRGIESHSRIAQSRVVKNNKLKNSQNSRRSLKNRRGAARPLAAIVRVESNDRPRANVMLTASRHKPIFGEPSLVAEARKYLGTNPTNRSRLWCATFMNLVLTNVGYPGTGSDAARSFASYGRRISEPKIGAIAVLTRGRNGGHVGVVTGIDRQGNPIIISGNHRRRVGEAVYSRKRVIAYVMPVGNPQPTRLAALRLQTTTPRGADIQSEGSLVSPIAELLAAINNEPPGRNPALAARAAAPRAQPVLQPRPVVRAKPVPQRLVQQMPDTVSVERVTRQMPVAPASRPVRHSLPLDPALARLFGRGR